MDIYKQALAPSFNAEKPLHGVVRGMPMDEYRNRPGFAPSDIKMGCEDLKWGKGGRGHLLRIAVDKMIRQHQEKGEEIPAWLGEPRKTTDAFALGTLYHTQLLTPDLFDDEFAVLTAERIEEFLARAVERKRKEAPQEFSFRLGVARQWRKENPGQEPTEKEKALLLEAAQNEKIGKVNFHANLTEFEEWKTELTEAGKTMVTQSDMETVNRMIDALYSLPENSEVGEYLKTLPKGPDRVETSLFANLRIQSHDGEDLPEVQLKGRPDWLPGDGSVLDPKSSISSHPVAFGNQVENLGYDISMAGYTVLSDLLQDEESAKGLGFPADRVGFLSQEKTAPFLARIYWLPDSWLQYARKQFMKEVTRLVRSYISEEWSDVYMQGGVQELLPSPWKAREIEGVMG